MQKIIICDRCHGTGSRSKCITAYESEQVTCSECLGSGKLIKTITFKPYKE